MSAVHNWINFDTMTQVLNSGVTAKGNKRNNACNGAHKGSLNVGAETEKICSVSRFRLYSYWI